MFTNIRGSRGVMVNVVESGLGKPSLEVVGPRGAMANALNCDIVVNEFELQSFYYIHFQINTLGKDMKHS